MRHTVFILFFMLHGFFSYSQDTGTLHIEVTDLRNNIGQVGIRLFDQSKGFPTKRNMAIKEYFTKPVNGKAVFVIESLAFDAYAIGTIHDENENKEFDKNFIGYPKEGFGTSNNPKIFMGPPSFEKAKFDFSADNHKLIIKMVYF